MLYLTVKALHIMAVISWMAALLYLPRLFVYHAEAGPGGAVADTFKVMERRLYRAIMTPAMIATWLLGLWLVHLVGFGTLFSSWWFPAKFALVLVMSGFHGFLGKELRGFAADARMRPARFYRMINEVPALIMVAIVALVVIKPF